MPSFITETLLDAVTATTISRKIDLSAYAGGSIHFIATGVTLGNGVFSAGVSNDGDSWAVYNRLIPNVTNTNVQQDTRVASITLSSNSSSIVFLPATDAFRFMRVTVTRTTDGTYSAVINARS